MIDEASLTGESDPIKKSPEEDPWCRSGTQVSEGSGRVFVVAVGPQSEWGKTMALVACPGPGRGACARRSSRGARAAVAT